MKNKTLIGILVFFMIFGLGLRSRYAGDIDGEYITDDTIDDDSIDFTDVTYDDLSWADADIFYAVKTVIKTLDLNDDSSTDDFTFDDDATDSTAQNVDLGAIIPVWSEITSVVIRCFESVGAGTFQVIVGTTSAANNLLAQATVDGADEFAATAATASPVVATTAAAQHVWVNGDPSGNWDAAGDAGRWSIIITYIDYGTVHTDGIP